MEKNQVNIQNALNICIVIMKMLVIYAHGHGQESTTSLTPAMFIFGDSLIDSGNNNYIATIAKADYFPYGIDFGFPTGRFCNGLTAVDFGCKFHLMNVYLVSQMLTIYTTFHVTFTNLQQGIWVCRWFHHIYLQCQKEETYCVDSTMLLLQLGFWMPPGSIT